MVAAEPGKPDLPLVTVVMPVFNEASWIDRSLTSVLGQDYPADRVEILIADSRSEDQTVECVHRAIRRHAGRRIRLLHNPRRTPGAALNLMIGEARGEIIVRVDGHSEIALDYIRNCVRSLCSHEALNVGGCVRSSGAGYVGRAIAAATGSFWGNGGARYRSRPPDEPTYVDTVQFGAWRRGTLLRLGPFVEEWPVNEDCEFNARIRHAGGKVLLDPAIRATYFSRRSLRTLARQYFRYGLLKWRVIARHPRQLRARQLAPPALVVALGASVTAAFAGPAGDLPMAVPAIYLAAILMGAARIGMRSGQPSSTWILPFVFATMHLSYGIGVLVGMCRDVLVRTAHAATRVSERLLRPSRSGSGMSKKAGILKKRDAPL